MNQKKENREEMRTKNLVIPVNKQESEKIAQKAKDLGLSKSAFARMILRDFFKKDEVFNGECE